MEKQLPCTGFQYGIHSYSSIFLPPMAVTGNRPPAFFPTKKKKTMGKMPPNFTQSNLARSWSLLNARKADPLGLCKTTCAMAQRWALNNLGCPRWKMAHPKRKFIFQTINFGDWDFKVASFIRDVLRHFLVGDWEKNSEVNEIVEKSEVHWITTDTTWWYYSVWGPCCMYTAPRFCY